MKNLTTTLLLLLVTLYSLAQNQDNVLARVSYTYINQNDTLKNGKPFSENMMLFAGKNASLYVSYDKIRHAINIDQKVRAMMTLKNGSGSITIDSKPLDQAIQGSQFVFANEKKYFYKETVQMQDFSIEEPLPSLNWKIINDSLTIYGIQCKKATVNFEGKNWIAWFAPNLPFSSGPYKFNSLPGLIIEVYNEDKSIQYQFAGLENAKDNTYKRLVDVTKKSTSQPGDVNPLDLMMGTDIADAYYSNIIKLPYNSVKTTKGKLEKFKADLKGVSNK